jgi:Kef-type K+ transport system membrane component KefB
MSWLTDWGDAAKQPKRALALMLVAGLLGGGLLGYFRFDHSPAWAAILGVSLAATLTYVGWNLVRDPESVQWRRSREGFTRATVGLVMSFAALAVAFIVGRATHSEHVFVIVFAVGLALSLVLRFTVRR